MRDYDYDLITIGAGSGGVRASRLAGGWGKRVAVVEKSRVGGTCVMRGCVPKKLLIYGAHYAEEFEDARGYGWTVAGVELDWGALIEAKNRELDRLEGVYGGILRRNHVALIDGKGVLEDAHTVDVAGERFTAEKILIACGGWPALPNIPGIECAITSNEALELPDLPEHVVIVGGGYIAVEFAGIFRAAGARVTQVIRGAELLRGFDEDVRTFLGTQIEKRGIILRRNTMVRALAKTNDGISVALGEDGETLRADVVMYATGRAPNTHGIGLAEAGVELALNGAVIVDEWNRSSVPNIFAVGDCTDRVNLTPVAIAEGHAFAETNFNSNPRRVSYENIPSAVFSQPPVSVVGLTETQAMLRGPIDVYISRFRPMRHTISGRDESTMMKLVVCADTGRVLGCHMVGADAPEIIQGLAVALQCGATKAQFDATIGIHPTAAEEFVTMREKRPAE
ncbi:MAG: glutathione-disulfide reductase [Rhodospirillales bacterium]|nr:glutathione-disulfide reductase [Rhodospirillales bacterium]